MRSLVPRRHAAEPAGANNPGDTVVALVIALWHARGGPLARPPTSCYPTIRRSVLR